MSLETSVISGALLYSKGISYLLPIGKRRVLFAKRSYILIDTGSNPCTGNKKDGQPKLTAFYSMLEHPEGASELVFSLPFMLSKHLSTFAASCFEDLPCLSLLLMSVRK